MGAKEGRNCGKAKYGMVIRKDIAASEHCMSSKHRHERVARRKESESVPNDIAKDLCERTFVFELGRGVRLEPLDTLCSSQTLHGRMDIWLLKRSTRGIYVVQDLVDGRKSRVVDYVLEESRRDAWWGLTSNQIKNLGGA